MVYIAAGKVLTSVTRAVFIQWFLIFGKIWFINIGPEVVTFTYGDPTSPKAGLRHLQQGDYLIFYCGLEGWDYKSEPALYLMGYFEISAAGYASGFTPVQIQELFGDKFF